MATEHKLQKKEDSKKHPSEKPCFNNWKNKLEVKTKFKFEHKTQKQMFALMDAHWAKKAKKEASKASKEFTALSIILSLDSLDSDNA